MHNTIHGLTTSTTSHRPSKRYYTLVVRRHSQPITSVSVFGNCGIKLGSSVEYYNLQILDNFILCKLRPPSLNFKVADLKRYVNVIKALF